MISSIPNNSNFSKMDIEKSRNGYYTLTFYNKNKLEKDFILKEFNTVGPVHELVQKFNRVFIRYKEKEKAEKALEKFGKIYDVGMALNSNYSHIEGRSNHNHNHNNYRSNNQNRGHHNHNHNHHQLKQLNNPIPYLLESSKSSNSSQSMEKEESTDKVYNLILGNLPKNYTISDINSLVEEVKPVSISPIDETRVFHLKFCHIVLDSAESLKYLIDKLNGFVICGEKLMAAELGNLLEWSQKGQKGV